MEAGAISSQGTASIDAQSEKMFSRVRSEAASGPPSSKEDAKITKAGKDFESILLANWLQQAEQSFAKVPGGDGEGDDDDSSKDQFQGIAMQALAGSLTESGGIGIAKMVIQHLHAAGNSHPHGGKADAKASETPAKAGF